MTRIYYDMLWSSSLWASASRFWRQVSLSCFATIIWGDVSDVISSPLRTDRQTNSLQLYLKGPLYGRSTSDLRPTVRWAAGQVILTRMLGLVHCQVVECNDWWSREKMWGLLLWLRQLQLFGHASKQETSTLTWFDLSWSSCSACSGISQVSNFFVCMASLKTSNSLKQSQSISAGTLGTSAVVFSLCFHIQSRWVRSLWRIGGS